MPRKPPHDGIGDYTVGYAKPPLAHRFQKGRSGNPQGRRKSANTDNTADAHAHLWATLNEFVTITEHGRQKRVKKIHVVLKQLTNRAMTGETKSQQLLFNVVTSLHPGAATMVPVAPTAEHDDKVIAQLLTEFAAPTDSAVERVPIPDRAHDP